MSSGFRSTGAGISTPRSSAVDLIKILGCFFVIALHCNPGNIAYVTTSGPRDFWFSIFLLGVPLFLVQAGFFLFREKNPITRYRKYLVGLLFPTIVVMMGLIWIEPWTWGYRSLPAVLFDIRRETLRQFLYALSHWNSKELPDCVIHLWYMAEYSRCVLIAPLVALFCCENRWCTLIRRAMLVLLFAITCSMDYLYYFGTPVFPGWFFPFSNSFLYLLAGYEIYRKKDVLAQNAAKTTLIALTVFVLCTAMRSLVLIPGADNPERFLDYNSACSLLQASAICCLCLGGVRKSVRILSRIGSRTFAMYLIHLCFVQKLMMRGVTEKIHDMILSLGLPAAIGETVYVFAVPVLIFLAVYLVADLILILHETAAKGIPLRQKS